MKTFKGPWSAEGPESPADGEIWEVELDNGEVWVQTTVAVAGHLVDCLGSLDSQPEKQLRFRRVWPPGSVVPVPKDLDHQMLGDWPWWMVANDRDRFWSLERRVDVIDILNSEEELTGYRVQQLDNGVFVAVPWPDEVGDE